MRRTSTISIPESPEVQLPDGRKIAVGNRDKGKLFLLTEMPAMQAEQWAIRALLAIASTGVSVPEELKSAGMAGLAVMSLSALAFVRYEDAKPLLDEMLTCIEYIPDPSKPHVKRELHESDIEEVQTLVLLRKEVWNLHMGFSQAASTPNTP